MTFESLYALSLRTSEISRIRIADGTVSIVHTGTPMAYPDGIVLLGDRIHWTTMGAPTRNPDAEGEASLDYSARNGGVHSVSLDGANPADLTAPGAITTGKQLTADAAGRLYWGDREGFRVTRMNPDGSGLTDLVVNVPGGEPILDECVGVAVDDAAGHLYWTQKGPAKGGRGRIFRAGLELSAGQTAENRTDIEVLWDALPEPIDLEIHDGHLYWTDRGAEPNGNTLNRAPLPAEGTVGAAPEILARGFTEAIGLAIDAEASLAYVSDLGGRLYRVPLSGGAPEVVADLGTPLSGIAGR